MFKGVSKKCDLSENNVSVASDPNAQNSFFNTIQLVSLDLIKLWSVTCPSTLESLQEMEFEVNNDINWKVSLCQGDITKLNVDAIEISAKKALIVGGVIVGVIHEAARPGLWGEFQKLNGCETDECKVTLGYKLPALELCEFLLVWTCFTLGRKEQYTAIFLLGLSFVNKSVSKMIKRRMNLVCCQYFLVKPR